MIAAAPFDCHACGRRIGKPRNHLIVRDKYVLCVRCMDDRRLHTIYYPDCDALWHDMFDHGVMLATRAGAWCVLAQLDGQRADQ